MLVLVLNLSLSVEYSLSAFCRPLWWECVSVCLEVHVWNKLFIEIQFVPRSKHVSTRLNSSANAVCGINHCIFWYQYTTHKCTLCAERRNVYMLKLLVHKVTTELWRVKNTHRLIKGRVLWTHIEVHVTLMRKLIIVKELSFSSGNKILVWSVTACMRPAGHPWSI
jgi:hypothetical protein